MDGTNIMLTIDYTVQSVLEKYLKQAFEDNNPNAGVRGIIMDVNNGEILAMANYPDYDLNDAMTLSDYYQGLYDAYAANPEKTEEEKNEYKWNLMYEMWKNRTVTELFYPGSTFKMVTAAAALEEGTSSINDTFNCAPGGITIMGQTYHCHTSPHGLETFSEALVNSCNPALIQIGQSLGAEMFLSILMRSAILRPPAATCSENGRQYIMSRSLQSTLPRLRSARTRKYPCSSMSVRLPR